MSIDSLLHQIDAEIAKLTQARVLLSGIGKGVAASSAVAGKSAPVKASRKKRVLSPEARKRIADAQRKRWAAQKSKSKSK